MRNCIKNLKNYKKKNKANLPKYEYPENIITVSKIAYCIEKGISLSFNKNEVKHHRGLDSQKKHGKALFGSGFIVSDKAAAAAAAAAVNKKN